MSQPIGSAGFAAYAEAMSEWRRNGETWLARACAALHSDETLVAQLSGEEQAQLIWRWVCADDPEDVPHEIVAMLAGYEY